MIANALFMIVSASILQFLALNYQIYLFFREGMPIWFDILWSWLTVPHALLWKYQWDLLNFLLFLSDILSQFHGFCTVLGLHCQLWSSADAVLFLFSWVNFQGLWFYFGYLLSFSLVRYYSMFAVVVTSFSWIDPL